MKNMILKIKENPAKTIHDATMAAMFAMLVLTMMNAIPMAFAVDATPIVHVIFNIIRIVVIALGAFMVVLGIVKFSMAYADQNSPDQQKSIMQMASGIALLLLGFLVLPGLEGTVAGWINEAADVN